jgi:hypothetical protein
MKELLHNGYVVNRIRRHIKDGDVHNFTNQPRNVVYDPGFNEGYTLGVIKHYILTSLITELAMKYPQYTFFVAVSTGYIDGPVRASDVTVFAGEEAIGSIQNGESYTNNSFGVEMRNRRIENDMERGTFKKTSKLKTAMALFGRYFYPRTMNEIMEHSASELHSAVNSALWTLKSKHDAARNQLVDFLRDRVKARDPALMQFLNTEGKSNMVDDMDTRCDELGMMDTLHSKLHDGGQHICLMGDDYITWRKGKSSALDGAKRCKREEIPDSMRTALALLKLSEPNTCVQGAGYKLDDTNYFIYDEVQLEFDD